MLEGIGLIVKYKKNKIRWNGQDSIHNKKKNGLSGKKRDIDSEVWDEY